MESVLVEQRGELPVEKEYSELCEKIKKFSINTRKALADLEADQKTALNLRREMLSNGTNSKLGKDLAEVDQRISGHLKTLQVGHKLLQELWKSRNEKVQALQAFLVDQANKKIRECQDHIAPITAIIAGHEHEIATVGARIQQRTLDLLGCSPNEIITVGEIDAVLEKHSVKPMQ